VDRQNFYFRQRVTEQEMREFQDYVESADQKIVTEILGDGIVTGGTVTQASTPNQTQVQVEPTIIRSPLGKRIVVQNQLGDTVASIVRGLTLQLDGISVPSTVGTYILFTSAPPVEPFTLTGLELGLSRSEFAGNIGGFTIQQVVTTDWGGLIPTQIMVRVDDELDEQGYQSGLSPRGTTVLSRIVSTANVITQTVFDELAQDSRPVNPGNERWVTLYARFARIEFDTRLDGNAQLVDFESLESFVLVVDATNPEAGAGLAIKPPLRTNDDVLLADVLLVQGGNILDARIDISRHKLLKSLPSTANRTFQYMNVKLFGPLVAWDGTNLSTDSTMSITLPDSVHLITIPAFNFALADGEVVYFQVPRAPLAPVAIAAVKTTRGATPEGDDGVLTIEFAGRVSTKLQGLFLGEMEPGEERTVGDTTSQDIFTYVGATSEVDNAPSYALTTTGGKTGQTNYGGSAGESLTSRLSKISSAVADKAQDKTVGFLTDFDSVSNTTSGPDQNIAFLGGAQELKVAVPSSANLGTIGLTGTLVLPVSSVAYVTINRNAAFTVANLAALTVATIAATPVSENIFIVAFRLSGTAVYLWDGQIVRVGTQSLPFRVAQKARQDANADIVDGGTWAWDLGTTSLSFTADAYIQVLGLPLLRNRIPLASSPILITADGDIAYVEVNRDSGANADLTVVVATAASFAPTDNTMVIARRIGGIIYLGRNASTYHQLLPGRSTTDSHPATAISVATGSFVRALDSTAINTQLALVGIDDQIDKFFGQLRLYPHPSDPERLILTGSDVTMLDAAVRVQTLGGLLMNFDGAQLAIEGANEGTIYASDGTTPIGAFVVATPGVGLYQWYGVSLNRLAVGSDNRAAASVLVSAGLSDNASLSAAPRAAFTGTKSVAQYALLNNGGVLEVAEVDQLGSGAGDGGGGLTVEYKAASFTAEAGKHYLTNSLPGAIVVTLPTTNLLGGETIRFSDPTFSWGNANNVTLDGDTIDIFYGGVLDSTLVLDLRDTWIELVYDLTNARWATQDAYWPNASDTFTGDLEVVGSLYINGRERRSTRIVTATETLTVNDNIIFAKPTIANIDVTLPPHLIGASVSVIRVSTFLVTVLPASGTILGSASFLLAANGDSAEFISDGTDYYIR